MNILVIGCNGQLGRDMVTESRQSGHTVSGLDFPDIDITSPQSVNHACQKLSPDSIINCAAYTAVDACEDHQETAFAINSIGVANIAKGANEVGASVVHISTDYVFDGTATRPYQETDTTNPQSVYGKSKLAGEQQLTAHTEKYFIFRIAWLYGMHGANFVKTIRDIAAKKLRDGQPLKVVNDQFGTPTFTKDVCRQILTMIPADRFGLYHCTNEGECSWFDFACFICTTFAIPLDVIPCTSAEFPRPAPRPRYSVLENHHLKSIGLHTMRPWQEAYLDFLREATANC
jgi:dTDP-4-dehydrorhamnose reductase